MAKAASALAALKRWLGRDAALGLSPGADQGISRESGPIIMAWIWAVPRWQGSPAITAIALLNCANS